MDRRKQKKNKKRELKRKKIREAREKQRCMVRAEDLAINAFEACDEGDHSGALSCALKALKTAPDDHNLVRCALYCAHQLRDYESFYKLLVHLWKHKVPARGEAYLDLVRLAIERRDLTLAARVCHDLKKGNVPLARPLTKAHRRTLEKELDFLYKWDLWQESIKEVRQPDATAVQRQREEEILEIPAAAPMEAPKALELEPEVDFILDGSRILKAFAEGRRSDAADLGLAREAHNLSFRSSFDQLLSLPYLSEVTSLWYQEETARKVMKAFRGRAILADEVGLGKTIEAGLVLKEYTLRGLVKSALILVPSTLVDQWRGELEEKFGLSFVTTNDPLFRKDPEAFWRSPFILASIQTAKSRRNFDAAVARSYDMVVVDEAHHLKNRRTLNWKLVNSVKKNFLLLLTATPVQNNLEELYNLITLLKPGHLKTRKAFMTEFVTRGNPTDPRNREKLRELLKEVMVRNTRSIARLNLPPRFAQTVRVSPAPEEEAFYAAVADFAAEKGANGSVNIHRMTLRRLLEAAGSSVPAALGLLERMAGGKNERARELAGMGRGLGAEAKLERISELLSASSEKKVVYVNYAATLEHLHRVLEEEGLPHAVFHGGMSSGEKRTALERFRGDCPVLLSTGVGGEGHNLQFCRLLINYDLPWNPMEIEQRIGRLHRIGQEREVEVFNFCTAGSIEEHILKVLDKKINMFELVIGEIDMILGRMKGEQEFADLVFDIWVGNRDGAERRRAFGALAGRLKRARSAYETSKELDEKLFREDFGL